jgi:hypothetical protein
MIELRVAGDAGRKLGRQRNGFVKRVGVQRLGAAENCRHRFDGGADDVVVRILLGQRPAGRLAVRAQHHRLRALGVELGHDAMPEQTGSAHLGDFKIEVHADSPEEGQATGEGIDVHAGGNAGTDVFHAVGQREGQFDRLIGAGFLDVVTGNRDRVELRHVLRGVAEDVGNDFHRRLGRIDIGVPHHELFEDVVLDGARQAGPAARPALRRQRCRRPEPAARRRSWSSRRRPYQAECCRRGSSYLRRSRSPRRLCQRRPRRGD